MADLIALHAALAHMGFAPVVAMIVTDVKGMENLDEFHLIDNDGVDNLCKVIHRPGGQITNPVFAAAGGAAAAAAAGIPAQIANPGFIVLTHAETNLKLMCYFLCYCWHMSCVTVMVDITLDAV